MFSYLGGMANQRIDILIKAFSDLQDDRAELMSHSPCGADDRRLRELQAKIGGKNIKIRGMATDPPQLGVDISK